MISFYDNSNKDQKFLELVSNGETISYRLETNYGTFDVVKDVFKNDIIEVDGIIDVTNSNRTNVYSRGIIEFVRQKVGLDKPYADFLCGMELEKACIEYNTFNKRHLVQDVLKYLNTKVKITVLYGTRRTGKTVMMFHTISELLKKGVPTHQIMYMNLYNDSISSEILFDIMLSFRKFGIKYLFVDEITYCKGDLNFLTAFSDSTEDMKIILAGTHSIGFISLLDGVLYDRAHSVHTTYISFKEFEKLYPNSTIDNYIEAGGILRDTEEYRIKHNITLDDYIKDSSQYMSTAIRNNVFNCFSKFDLEQKYPRLVNYYYEDQSKLKTMLIKWMQFYSKKLTLRMLKSMFKSDDIGNLRDILGKRGQVNNIGLLSELLYDEFCKNINFQDYDNYVDEDKEELIELFKDLDCLIEIEDMNLSIIIPVILRTGFTYEIIKSLNTVIKEFINKTEEDINIEEVKNILLNNVKGILLETVIDVDLYKAGYSINKYNKDGIEVELILDNSIYEIKHSKEKNCEQLKWLLHPIVLERFKPETINVLYNGSTESLEIIPKQVYGQIIEDRLNKGLTISKHIQHAYDDALTTSVVINYINVNEFLLSK